MSQMHFEAMREFFNTLSRINLYFNVRGAIARQLQHDIACGCSLDDVYAVRKASRELCNQIGF